MQKLLTFFSQIIDIYIPYLMIKVLTILLTNDIDSFEQLGPDYFTVEQNVERFGKVNK